MEGTDYIPPTVPSPLSPLRRRIEALERSSWSSRDDVFALVNAHERRSMASTSATVATNDDDDDDGDGDGDGEGGGVRAIARFPPPLPEGVRRARRHVQMSHCYSSVWKCVRAIPSPPPSSPSSHPPPRVPSTTTNATTPYYSMDLEGRRAVLGAHTIRQLCKSCLFENRNHVPSSTTTTTTATAFAYSSNAFLQNLAHKQLLTNQVGFG